MKKILAVCFSTIQTYFVINLCHTIFKNDKVDVIFTDDLKYSSKLVESANKNGVFHRAYYVVCAEQSRKDREAKGFRKLDYLINRRKNARKAFAREESYDYLLFNSTNSFTQGLYENLYNINNNLKVYFIEDGFSTYCVQGDALLNKYKKNKKLYRRIIYGLFGIRLLIENIDAQLMYTPEAAQWEAPFERIRVPQIDTSKEEIRRDFNLLFQYQNMKDQYDTPIIFFEECYRADGIEINDVELVEKLDTWVGKENSMVKMQPINRKNIYKELGYKTNENIEIPWEVIFMNQPEMENKLLISIASGCIVTPYTMFGSNGTVIALFNMKQINPGNFYPDYYEYFREHIFKERPDLFLQPSDMNEFHEMIQQKFIEIQKKKEKR